MVCDMEPKLEKIDIHGTERKYQIALERLRSHPLVCEHNRALIERYLGACQLGRTIFGKEKKRIAAKRLLKYSYLLARISHWLGNVPFEQVPESAVERFVVQLEADTLTYPSDGTEKPVHYAPWTRRDIKITLKKFYKWLLGDGRQFPPLVAWIDTHIKEETPTCLSMEEIRRLASFTSSRKGKALVWALFETGARAEEFLNVRLGHVEDRGTRLLVRIEYSKTFRRSVPIYEGAVAVREWIAEHPMKADPGAQLFPIGYRALGKFLERLSRKALRKRVTAHMLRHSYATWLASKKVGRYQMCKLMGWAMSSNMPDRYIDRAGVAEEDAIMAIRGDELHNASREIADLKAALARVEGERSDLHASLTQRRAMDSALDIVFDDNELLKAAVARLKQVRGSISPGA